MCPPSENLDATGDSFTVMAVCEMGALVGMAARIRVDSGRYGHWETRTSTVCDNVTRSSSE